MNVFLALGKAEVSCDSNILHEQGSTISNHESYIIALDQAVVKVNNNSKIVKGAKGSNANQVTKGLNIGDNSQIIADPNLFIEEHDVIAHHGAAIGSLNKDELFYLMSRGLTEEQASKIIIMGFLQPLLDHITDELTKTEIKEDFEHKLK
jgi:Fe-S cluster assembly protein SufD